MISTCLLIVHLLIICIILSHYQVIAVLLDQDTSITSLREPDMAFSDMESFSTYETAGSDIRTRGYAGYITAEFRRELFPSNGRFTVGDPMETANDKTRNYPNNPLQYGSRYTFFLRAYPLLNTGPALVSVWACAVWLLWYHQCRDNKDHRGSIAHSAPVDTPLRYFRQVLQQHCMGITVQLSPPCV